MFIFGRYKQLDYDEALTMDVHSVWNWAETWTKMLRIMIIVIFPVLSLAYFILNLFWISNITLALFITFKFRKGFIWNAEFWEIWCNVIV